MNITEETSWQKSSKIINAQDGGEGFVRDPIVEYHAKQAEARSIPINDGHRSTLEIVMASIKNNLQD